MTEEQKAYKVVYKVTDEDPYSVYCTTYQMRNFYKQFADGFFSKLDVMNYIQHCSMINLLKKGDVVLDMCCGRGLVLPLLRYQNRISAYYGFDISEKNLGEQLRWSGAKRIDNVEEYYPFEVKHIKGKAEDTASLLDEEMFDVIFYTSSIEHMQKESGIKSLEVCFKLLKHGGRMFFSTPNTADKEDKYDTHYAAHLYEWDKDEVITELTKAGFVIEKSIGLVCSAKAAEEYFESPEGKKNYQARKLRDYLPTAWFLAILPIMIEGIADEVAIICRKPMGRLFSKKGK